MITTRKRTNIYLFAVLLLFTTIGGVAATASDVDPVYLPDNPSCSDVGYDYGFKVDPPNSGTYAFPLTTYGVTISTADGVYFDWTSELGVDAVIVKGGPDANLYIYDPPTESFGDTGLHSPINPNNQMPYGLSHIEFCYDFEVDVSKTANTTFTRTYNWTIDKSVTPDTWHLFTGDSGTSRYTVAVTRSFTDSDWAVTGTITIENNTPFAATIESVGDVISGFGGAVAVNCGVTFPYVLPSSHDLFCSYGTFLPDGSDRTNTATVETSGLVGGGNATEAIVFGDPTTIHGYETVNVTDTNGGSWQFSGTGSVSYERTFTCSEDAGSHYNIATIGETGQTDDATVTVNCYDLGVSKTAETSYNRYWDWTVDKWADQTSLTLSAGQQLLVNYWVEVDAEYTDADYAVAGEITLVNNTPLDAMINGVGDVLSGYGAVTVDCGVAFPYTLPAGATLICDYGPISLPDGTTRTNTATATLQNYDFASDGAATVAGTTDFSGSADVVFGDPADEIDECIDVSDTFAGFLGTVCAGSALPVTFSYSRWIGPYDACGEYTVTNIASFITNDNGDTGSASWTIDVTVPCAGGCTLTPGYWKTHSEYGPAPYDDTWALLSNGADTPFFSTGYTYFEILHMPPQGGNAYLILAHAYIAAELNVLNGASIPPDVLDAWIEAQALLVAYESEASIPKNQKVDRARAIYLAGILDDYNNGYIGPGHCSE
jgi:hypothetical protein